MSQKGANPEVSLPRFLPNISVLRLLMDALKTNGNKTAQIEGASGTTASYADILQQSCCIAAGLQSRGVAAGDLVVFCCEKSILTFCTLLATFFSGATAVLVKIQDVDKFHELLNGHVVKIVFCETKHLESVTKCISNLVAPPLLLVSIDPTHQVMASLLSATQKLSLFHVTDIRKHIPLILFTSGSTGIPKGVPISDFALQRIGYSIDDSKVKLYLLTSQFSWISSSASLISSLLKCYTLVLSNNPNPASNLQLIQKYRVNGWSLASSAVRLYSEEYSKHSLDLTSLKIVYIGGEVMLKKVRELFVNKVLGGRIGVHSIYGMTEAGVLTGWTNSTLDLTKANSSGHLAPGVEIKIIDDDGNILPTWSTGELCVKALSLMAGYWDRPDLNSDKFDEDGFFHTGDAGYFDDDGYLYVSGRISDLINFQGTKISISEVEDTLKSHTAVLDAAIVGKPDPVDINHLVAFVIKKPNDDTTENEIKAFVEDRVEDRKKIRGGVHFLDKLPRTTSGKVQRQVLMEMVI